MLAPKSSRAPSSQFAPVTRNIEAAKALPSQAKPAITCFLRGDRSAAAPTTGSTRAETMVARVTT